MMLRDERPGDADAIDAVVAAAFRDHPFSNQREPDLIRALRATGGLTVALVAVDADGTLLGHIAFSPATIGTMPGWQLLGPLAVQPGHQRAGIGSALVMAGLGRLRAAGAAGAVLVGAPGYYGRFGFRPFPGMTVAGIPDVYVLACPFGDAVPSGPVHHHPAFATAIDG